MLKEKNPILKLKIKVENSTSINKIFEALYSLYHFILNEPLEINFLDFCSILLSYLQLIAFIFDDIVSTIKNINNIFSIYIN